MTSSNTDLTEISDAAQRLPQGGKETAGRYNPATFISLGKGRCPAKQDNKTYLPALPMALTMAAAAVARGTSGPALPRRRRGSRQGPLPGQQRRPAGNAGRQPVNPAKWPGSRRIPTFLVPALSTRWHERVRVKGPAGSSAPEKPEMGTTGKAPPQHGLSLGRSAEPCSSRLGAEVPKPPASPPAAAYFWLPS